MHVEIEENKKRAAGLLRSCAVLCIKRGNHMNEIVSNLLVYGSLPEDSILWQLADICEKLKNQTESKDALRGRVFHQVKNLLTVATDYAFDKNLWHNYLTFLLITNENPFSLVCEKMVLCRCAVHAGNNDPIVCNNNRSIFLDAITI